MNMYFKFFLLDILKGNIQNGEDDEGEQWKEFNIDEIAKEKDPEIDDLSALSDNGDDSESDEEEQEKKKKVKRVRWSAEEINEVKKFFKENLRTKTCPSKQDCLKAIAKSKKNGGKIGNRYWHTIVKKISNMNKSSKK